MLSVVKNWCANGSGEMYSIKSAQTAGISNAHRRDNKCRGNSPQSHVRLWRSAWRGVWGAETAPVIREQSPVWDSWSADDHLKMCLGDELYSVWGFQHCWIWGVTFHHMENVTWGVNVLLLSTHSTCRLLPPSQTALREHSCSPLLPRRLHNLLTRFQHQKEHLSYHLHFLPFLWALEAQNNTPF